MGLIRRGTKRGTRQKDAGCCNSPRPRFGEVTQSMSAYDDAAQERTDTTPLPDDSLSRFTPVDAGASPLDADELRECRDPSGPIPDDREPVFAVAHRAGIVTRLDVSHQYEATAVLYLTADGEQAVEQWYSMADAGDPDWSVVDRALHVDPDELRPTGQAAARLAPIVRRHPEVGG